MQGSKLVLAFAAVLAIAGCGLPDQYYIQSPIPGTLAQGAGNQFNFLNPDHSKDLNIIFKGYELYYQLYATSSTININAYDPSKPTDVNAQLLAAGFQPVTSGGISLPAALSADSYPSRTHPVIPVQSADIPKGFSVIVTIINSVTPAAQYIFSGGVPAAVGAGNLRRYVQDNSFYIGQYKDFQSNVVTGSSSNYSAGDIDCNNILLNIQNSTEPVFIAMYAVSYGLIQYGTIQATPQRSVPIYLGYLSINITH
jgi:hypothetical protein